MMFSLSTEPPFDGVLAVSEMLASKQSDDGLDGDTAIMLKKPQILNHK